MCVVRISGTYSCLFLIKSLRCNERWTGGSSSRGGIQCIHQMSNTRITQVIKTEQQVPKPTLAALARAHAQLQQCCQGMPESSETAKKREHQARARGHRLGGDASNITEADASGRGNTAFFRLMPGESAPEAVLPRHAGLFRNNKRSRQPISRGRRLRLPQRACQQISRILRGGAASGRRNSEASLHRVRAHLKQCAGAWPRRAGTFRKTRRLAVRRGDSGARGERRRQREQGDSAEVQQQRHQPRKRRLCGHLR